MGSASERQTTGRPLLATGINGVCRWSARPNAISFLPLTLGNRALGSCPGRAAVGWRRSGAFSGGGWLAPIGGAARPHRPDDPRRLVRQRHGGELARLARQQLQQPGWGGLVVRPGMADHRHGADPQQLAQPFIAGLADPTEPVLAAGGMLPRREAEP